MWASNILIMQVQASGLWIQPAARAAAVTKIAWLVLAEIRLKLALAGLGLGREARAWLRLAWLDLAKAGLACLGQAGLGLRLELGLGLGLAYFQHFIKSGWM